MQLDLILLNFLPQSLVWPAWSIGTLPWKTRLESTDSHPVVLTASMVGMAGSSRDPRSVGPPSTPVRGAWSSARRSRRNDAQRSSSRSLTGPLVTHVKMRA